MDAFKQHIQGYRGGGKTCSCCREVGKKRSRRLARRRLRAADARRLRR